MAVAVLGDIRAAVVGRTTVTVAPKYREGERPQRGDLWVLRALYDTHAEAAAPPGWTQCPPERGVPWPGRQMLANATVWHYTLTGDGADSPTVVFTGPCVADLELLVVRL